MNIKEEDIVMCTVKSIEGTTVFLQIEGNGEGSMMMSEVAAGRIRNLREYVLPNKKVVCKILKIGSDGHPQLSLRRVTAKEREEVEERYKKEKTFISLLGAVLKDSKTVVEEIRKKYELWEFVDMVKENPAILEEVTLKSEAQKIATLLLEKEEREKEAKKIFTLKTTSESGINDLKEILSNLEASVKYLGSSQFSIGAKGKDFKEANTKISNSLEQIEKKAKEKKATFELKEK